ncbi:tyrosine-type recombinase/integrase [Bosea rubneri]|uniref:Tyrosine-type recombinase/integrase n=1 Tax=Bosea rubneri TaxID=3075434 RepID=A0ABU3SGX4_9HYPH|nr:tyrosine-type recombinase/integrase [Bosea sp. ZW T0_25]MDU0343941.1 tyrosine-type recombinase/integrase [Bosea sp. ZW T0_25]
MLWSRLSRMTAFAKDPFLKAEKLERPHGAGEPHPTWADYELEAAIEDAIASNHPGLARALALARWGGFRRGTICAIPLNARVWGFDAAQQRHRRLSWITEKRRVARDKPEDSRLTQLLDRTPNRATTIAYNADAGVWKERQLSQAVERLVERLAKKSIMRSGLTLHGLRHARGVELAMAGASDAEIMAQIEHAKDKAAKIYRRQAERRGLADNGQSKIDNIIDLRAKPRTKVEFGIVNGPVNGL